MPAAAALPLDAAQVAASVQALLEFCADDASSPLSDPPAVLLQCCVKKVVGGEARSCRAVLPQRVTPPAADVCLLTRDVPRDAEADVTERHFRALLARHGAEEMVARIVPLHSLKKEHGDFEAKRALSNAHGVFLADAAVVRLLPRLLGKAFYGRARCPLPVDLDGSFVRHELEQAMRTATCQLPTRGSSCQLRVGHAGMTRDELAENVRVACEQLVAALPGGAANVRRLHVRTASSPALPVYADLTGADDVCLPKRRKRVVEECEEEVDTVEGQRVRITPSGDVVLVQSGASKPPAKKQKKQPKGTKSKTVKPKKPAAANPATPETTATSPSVEVTTSEKKASPKPKPTEPAKKPVKKAVAGVTKTKSAKALGGPGVKRKRPSK